MTTRWGKAGTVPAALLAAVFAIPGLVALVSYQGSSTVFLLFTICYWALAGLIFPRPRLYVYTFFAALLLLGFWMKSMVQVIWDMGFKEPVGDFRGTPAEWDAALLAASCAAIGVALARFVHLWLARRRTGGGESVPAASAPQWFGRFRKPIWYLTALLLVGLNVLNLRFGFFQVGVNPTLLLPPLLHVLVTWLINIGFALWVAALAYWEYRRNPSSLGSSLLAPIGEALLSSASGLSRLTYLLHAGPYWIALLERWREFSQHIGRRTAIFLGSLFAACFLLSIATVFVLRVLILYEYAETVPPEDSVSSQTRHTMKKQLPDLFIHRWCGLEGVLAVGSAPGRGIDLFTNAVIDNPKQGSGSLYQRYAKTLYLAEKPAKFTFLANAGMVAILWFSDSLLLVFAGMALVTTIAILTEHLAQRLTANPFLLAVAGAALANVVVQTTFPYLTMIFLLQLWVAIGFLGALQRFHVGRPAG